MTRRGIPPPEHGRELGPPAVPAACPDACRHEIARPAFRFAKGRLPKICYELGYELRFQILRIGLRSLSPRDQKLITVCRLPDVPSYRRSELGSCTRRSSAPSTGRFPNSQPGGLSRAPVGPRVDPARAASCTRSMSRLAERAEHAAYFRLLSALENAVNTVGGGGLASVRVPHRVCGDPWLGARSLIAGEQPCRTPSCCRSSPTR
jgi:hypothetical protein